MLVHCHTPSKHAASLVICLMHGPSLRRIFCSSFRPLSRIAHNHVVARAVGNIRASPRIPPSHLIVPFAKYQEFSTRRTMSRCLPDKKQTWEPCHFCCKGGGAVHWVPFTRNDINPAIPALSGIDMRLPRSSFGAFDLFLRRTG